MPPNNTLGKTPLERVRRRYETTDKKCPACGFIDSEGNWTSRSESGELIYTHICPSCGADREHTFHLY